MQADYCSHSVIPAGQMSVEFHPAYGGKQTPYHGPQGSSSASVDWIMIILNLFCKIKDRGRKISGFILNTLAHAVQCGIFFITWK